MATRAVALTVAFMAIDTATNLGKTGDAANITPRKTKDGVSSALTSATVAEVDATNFPGLYSVALTGGETDCNLLCVGGKSSTAGVAIIPTFVQMERLPDVAPGAIGGVATSADGSGRVGVAGYATGQDPATLVLATPANKLATDGTGRITVGTNADKTGYSLSQAFPANFSSLAINVSGQTTVQYGTGAGQINLSGGNLAGAVPSVTGAVGSVTGSVGSVTAAVTVGTNNDKTGYSLTTPYDPAKTAAQASDVTGSTTTLSALISGLSIPSAATIAGAVWGAGTRSLTTFGTLAADTATAVWGATTRTLSGFGTLVSDIVSGVGGSTPAAPFFTNAPGGSGSSPEAIAAAVWASSARTLTSFGSLVADMAAAVWSAASRTLTGAGASSGAGATVALSGSASLRSLLQAEIRAAGMGGEAAEKMLDDHLLATLPDIWDAYADKGLIAPRLQYLYAKKSVIDFWLAGSWRNVDVDETVKLSLSQASKALQFMRQAIDDGEGGGEIPALEAQLMGASVAVGNLSATSGDVLDGSGPTLGGGRDGWAR